MATLVSVKSAVNSVHKSAGKSAAILNDSVHKKRAKSEKPSVKIMNSDNNDDIYKEGGAVEKEDKDEFIKEIMGDDASHDVIQDHDVTQEDVKEVNDNTNENKEKAIHPVSPTLFNL